MKVRRLWTIWDRLFPGPRMRRAWNRRAREDSHHFIACGHSDSSEEFWASGRRDLEGAVLRDVVLGPGVQALEIGCGVGRLLRPLATRVAMAWGVDISEEMVAQAKRALEGVPHVVVSLTDGTLADFSDATLDLVYSFIVFQHISAKRSVSAYIREAARVLKAGGVFRFQVDGRPRRKLAPVDTWRGVWYTPRELRREVASHDFEVLDLWGEGTHYFWVTAIRRPEPGRPASANVRVCRREWDRPALEVLLARLGLEGLSHADAVLRGDRSLRELAQGFLEEDLSQSSDGDQYVRRAYEVILGREPDAEGLSFYRDEIAKKIPRENTLDCLLSSVELEDKLRPFLPARPS
ncbi:MAG: methyltransferase domain-containing protein [Acidobacteriota bacterium]